MLRLLRWYLGIVDTVVDLSLGYLDKKIDGVGPLDPGGRWDWDDDLLDTHEVGTTDWVDMDAEYG